MRRLTASSVVDLIGGTPAVALGRLTGPEDAEVLVKLEKMNPSGSVKDRAAYGLITDAEQRGLIKPGSVIVEPTSGNTGIGLAMIAAARGYRLILVMPDNMTAERISLLRAYGAEVVLTPLPSGCRDRSQRLGKYWEKLRGAICQSVRKCR
ncbi:PLP-dependent cysteine synthase family protein [Cohnella faecalis]|uniref:PLP-dependent cysteine synthase family protein n=1 Tax=Cohnella faecalis TaxID=2315694 RepID=UPI002694D533